MDDERKSLIVGGVYLGDITLALAGVATEIPQFVRHLDMNALMGGGEDGDAKTVAAEVEKALAGGEFDTKIPLAKRLPAALVKLTFERAVAKGKFLSATRCLEILDEKEAYVERELKRALALVGEGKFREGAEVLAIAAAVELNEGTPLFQYTGPELHEACTASREKCVTAVGDDEAVLRGLQYLLGGEKAGEAVVGLTPEARKNLLPHVALARDPDAGDFYQALRRAHEELVAIENGELAALRQDLKRAAGELAKLADSGGAGEEKALRTAQSLKKEFSDIESLVDGLQLTRLRRRLEQLLESRGDFESAKKGTGTFNDAVAAALKLIDEFEGKKILEAIDAVEAKIVATQVTMLGRAVASHEHWQYLRELAFKYPVSPLLCCVRRINAKWMVVPAWESPLRKLLAP
jgi:hypothetical protein